MKIIDNFMPMDRVHKIYNYLSSREWDFISELKSPTVKFQNRSLKHAGRSTNDYFPIFRFPLRHVEDFLFKIKELYPDYIIYDDFVGGLNMPKDFSHVKHYDFFEDKHIPNKDDLIRFQFYCVPEWKPEWGGNTEFYGRWRNEKIEPDVCEIKPNRLVQFDWDEFHTGTPWDNNQGVQRMMLTGYLFKKDADYAAKKTYRYVFGRSKPYVELYPEEKEWTANCPVLESYPWN